jgi:hypothetical protein
MAINLNPGADATLVNAAYRSAAGNAPADYSKTLQRAADSYDKTMEAQGETWGSFAKLGAKIGGEMMLNAEKLTKYAAAGAGLNPDDADMFQKEIYGIKDELKDLGIFSGRLGDRETRIKRQELLLKQKELFAEIDAAALTIQNGTQAVAAGLYDANLNEPEAEMVNAIIKSGLKDNVTEEGNIAKLTRDETTGELIYTLYKQNGEKAVLNGNPQTMTLDQFTKSIATNVDDKGLLKANMNKLNDEYAQMGNSSLDGVFDPQMQQLALNKLDNMLKTPTDLKRAMRTQFGYSNTSFYDDIQSPSTLSAGLYSTLLKATGGSEELPLTGVAEGVTDLDNSGGISQAELQNANNYAVLSANILGMKDPEVSKKFFKDYTVRKLEEAHNYGFSKKPPKKGSGTGTGNKLTWVGTNERLNVQSGNRSIDYETGKDIYDSFLEAKDGKATSFSMFKTAYKYDPKTNSWTDSNNDSFGNSDQLRKILGISEPDFKALTKDAGVTPTSDDEVITFGDNTPKMQTNKAIFKDIDVGDDDDAAENLNKRFGLNRRSDVMFAPYSEANLKTYLQTGLSGIGTGLFNADKLNSNDIMMYDPIKKEPIKVNGEIVRFKTGDEAFVKGGGLNPTADEIVKFLKEKYNIEYDPLNPK